MLSSEGQVDGSGEHGIRLISWTRTDEATVFSKEPGGRKEAGKETGSSGPSDW